MSTCVSELIEKEVKKFLQICKWIRSGLGTKYLPIDEHTSKMRHVHTMEYYLASKREDFWHATIWMKLEDIMESKANLLQMDTFCMIPREEGPRMVRFREKESNITVARGWERGNRKPLFHGTELPFGKSWRWWWWLPSTMNVLNATELCP